MRKFHCFGLLVLVSIPGFLFAQEDTSSRPRSKPYVAVPSISENVEKTAVGLLNPVVLIHAGPDNAGEQGAGVLTGNLGNELFILTAYHVIAEYPDQLSITFRNNQEASAEVVNSSEELDVAIIKCRIPAGFNIKSSFKFADKDPVMKEEIVLIGHPSVQNWRVNHRNQIDGLKHDLDDRLLEVTSDFIVGGYSGGAILNENHELLGILTDVNDHFSIGVKSAHLKKLLSRNFWNVPVNYMTGIFFVTEEEKTAYLGHLKEADKLFEEGLAAYRREGKLIPQTESILTRSIMALENALRILPSEELKSIGVNRYEILKRLKSREPRSGEPKSRDSK